jgi:hypothetical protein
MYILRSLVPSSLLCLFYCYCVQITEKKKKILREERFIMPIVSEQTVLGRACIEEQVTS